MKIPILALALAASLAAETRTLDLPGYRVELDTGSCVIRKIQSKDYGIDVIREPRLAGNFRILLPQPGYESNYFIGGAQRVSRISSEGGGLTCEFDELRNQRETVPVSVRYHVRSNGQQLEFSIDVENRTTRPLAEVMFGIIGGQQGIGNRLDTETLAPGAHNNSARDLFTRFSGGSYGGGNLGIRYSAAGLQYPGWALAMPWLDIFNRKLGKGIYYANHDVETRVSSLYYELHPFNKTAVAGDTWPSEADAGSGEPIGLTMGWVNYPYVRQGTFHGGPVVLAVHEDDWRAGSRIYRRFFDRHFRFPAAGRWLRREHAWQSVIISNCEDEILYRFRDLPRLAADAKKYGITTFEILGWHAGGIDRGYPQYTPDPRLGTPEEFRNALAEIRRMGVHPLLFANFQWADTATALFKNKLRKYAVLGRWADDFPLSGWGEGTIGARLGLTRSNMTLVSPSHPEFRRMLVDQFVDRLRDGAEGFQIDKVGGAGGLDFNPDLPVSPDRSLPAGILATFHEVMERGRAIYPNLAIASETAWDRVFPFASVSYLRMNAIDIPSTALRYTFPEWTSTIFAENPADFNVMNNGMRYGLVWALAPRHYNDSVDEPLTRPLSRYVQELIRIRKRHADLLFEGRFLDTEGATVQGGSQIRYSVFSPLEGGRARAVVVVNFGNEQAGALVSIPGNGPAELLSPYQADRKVTLPASIQIPARTCSVVVRR